MSIVFLGPPFAGKSTQRKLLAASNGFHGIAPGDMLAELAAGNGPAAAEARRIMSANEVGNELVNEIVRNRIDEMPASTHFVFDGFPRTTAQADLLQELYEKRKRKIAAVIDFRVTRDILISRIPSRQRAGDSLERLDARLAVYNQHTAPLTDYYRSKGLLKFVDGAASQSEVRRAILGIIANSGVPLMPV